MAMGAKTYTVPMVEPVRVASRLVRMQKAKINTKGLTLVPSILATVSPTRLVRPVLPRASAMPMTPADIRMMGALMELRISLKSMTPEIRMTPTARPVIA